MATRVMGRACIFRNKSGGLRVNGTVTKAGGKAVEQHRAALAALVGWKPARVSDADVIEYMAIGDAAARRYLGIMEG